MHTLVEKMDIHSNVDGTIDTIVFTTPFSPFKFIKRNFLIQKYMNSRQTTLVRSELDALNNAIPLNLWPLAAPSISMYNFGNIFRICNSGKLFTFKMVICRGFCLFSTICTVIVQRLTSGILSITIETGYFVETRHCGTLKLKFQNLRKSLIFF